jgi:hypothetical protein
MKIPLNLSKEIKSSGYCVDDKVLRDTAVVLNGV